MQIIELVGTKANAGPGAKTPQAGITAWLRTIASSEQVSTTCTGQGKRVFALDPITVEVIDASHGLLNVAVSRARRRLYAIGNRDFWGSPLYFDVLAARVGVIRGMGA